MVSKKDWKTIYKMCNEGRLDETAKPVCWWCEKGVDVVGVCNWLSEKHCKTCCHDKCDPDWRRVEPSFTL